MRRTVINVLAFTGGFVIMSLELLGGRVLAPYFGSSIYVWGSIITIFMLSLALGYLIGGRLSMRSPSLTRFALLFLFGSLLTFPLVLYGEDLMRTIFDHIEDPRYGSLVAAGALFALPTIVLGMISPYSVRLLVTETTHSGHVAGVLYFVSTLGSALGTLVTSFYLVLWFEIDTIVTLLAATLLVLAVIGLLAGQRP
jgi:MFS family permease